MLWSKFTIPMTFKNGSKLPRALRNYLDHSMNSYNITQVVNSFKEYAAEFALISKTNPSMFILNEEMIEIFGTEVLHTSELLAELEKHLQLPERAIELPMVNCTNNDELSNYDPRRPESQVINSAGLYWVEPQLSGILLSVIPYQKEYWFFKDIRETLLKYLEMNKENLFTLRNDKVCCIKNSPLRFCKGAPDYLHTNQLTTFIKHNIAPVSPIFVTIRMSNQQQNDF